MIIIPSPNIVGGGIRDSPSSSVSLFVHPSMHLSTCRWPDFQSVSQVCFEIKNSRFMRMLIVAIARSQLIFSHVTFKMAAWQPYWIFSCDQAALQMIVSVCLSVCPSRCLSVRPSHLFDYVPIIVSSWNFQELLPVTESDVHAKGQGQRSKVKVIEVTTQLYRFRTVTPVWTQVWWWNDAYSLIMLRRGALLFFKVICQISRSYGSQNRRIWPRLGVSGL